MGADLLEVICATVGVSKYSGCDDEHPLIVTDDVDRPGRRVSSSAYVDCPEVPPVDMRLIRRA